MVDLTKLTPQALSAAMRGGTAGWGQIGSAHDHIRYSQPMEKKSRKRCHCGCGNRKTHLGMANGVAMTSACELAIARWVRTGHTRPLSTPAAPAPAGGDAKAAASSSQQPD